MKRSITHAVAALFLMLAAAPLFAVQRNVVDEVIRMTRAGVAEDTILEYVERTGTRIDVSGDDVIAMTEARVPKSVIKAVVDAADTHRSSSDRGYSSPRVVVTAPYYGYGYDPYRYYNPYGYYYDPFWYRPTISLGFGFGRYYGGSRGYYGGHYGGHRHH